MMYLNEILKYAEVNSLFKYEFEEFEKFVI